MDSKSKLKRLCVQDPISMAEKLHEQDKEIDRLCGLIDELVEAATIGSEYVIGQINEVERFAIKDLNFIDNMINKGKEK